jgi:peptidoglycan hydrolase CwlO-like protein
MNLGLTAELFIFSIIFGAIGWLLKRRAEENTNAIADLYKKHEVDAKELFELRIRIADTIYKKGELDNRFDRLDSSLHELSNKLDSMRSDIAQHN